MIYKMQGAAFCLRNVKCLGVGKSGSPESPKDKRE